jgi:hypothetical protein
VSLEWSCSGGKTILLFLKPRAGVLRRSARKIAEARRRRQNLHVGDWRFSHDTQPHQAVDAVIGWCREVLASCPRPFGIDYFDFALALSHAGRDNVGSVSLQRLSPVSLYGEALHDQLSRLFDSHRDGRTPAQPVYVSAAIFSWGEAAHESLPARF